MNRLFPNVICALIILGPIFAIGCKSHTRTNVIAPGTYMHYTTSILVSSDELTIRFNGSPGVRTIMDSATIAKCKITYLEDNFYSLQSIDVPLEMFKDVSVEYIHPSQEDSTSVTFNFPNFNWIYYHNFKIIIYETSSAKEYSFVCNSDNFAVKIPRNCIFYVSLAPLEYVSYTVLNNYYGLLQFNDYNHIYSSHSDIIITMPNVTLDMFYRWFLNDVIVEADNNTITLFRDKYKKIK